MNERYKALAREAGLLVYNPEGAPTKLEKFAELIVNDCIQELEISRKCDPYTGNLYGCEYNKCIGEQIQVLKARFGVE